MESGKNNFKYYEHPHGKMKKSNKKILIFFGFLFVVGLIIFTILYSNGSITGNVISSVTGNTVSSINSDNSIVFSSVSTIPDLDFNGEYPEIKILSKAKTTIYIGQKSFLLDDLKENRIILKEFSGKIELDEEGILFNGKVSDVSLNNLPIQETNNRKIKIYVGSKIPYNLIEFKEDLFLKEIDYVTSGVLFLGEDNQDKITLDEDSFFVSNYFGELRINEDTLFLDGYAENMKISGDLKKISISK